MPKAVKFANQMIDPDNPGIDRPVVIKEFNRDDPGVDRALEILSYGFPCLPKLYQVEKTEDEIILYLEYIEGTHLYDLKPETHKDLLEIAIELARSLQLVHQHAEAVRDITPDNIIFRNGHAYFVDLSTLNTDYTPGYKPPEVDGSIFGGYSRASDIYQLGHMLRDFSQSLKAPFEDLTQLLESCLAMDPSLRPNAESLLSELQLLNRPFLQQRQNRLIPWILIPLTLAGLALIYFQLYPQDKIKPLRTLDDVIELRAEVATKSEAEKLDAAFRISQFLPETSVLIEENLQAIFAFDNPLLICQNKGLGLGSNVILRNGETGYIIQINDEEITVKTAQGAIAYSTPFSSFTTGLSSQSMYFYWPQKRIIIFPQKNNLELIINTISSHSNLKTESPISGTLAGFFLGDSFQDFIERHQKQLNLRIRDNKISQISNHCTYYFPVNRWLTNNCTDLSNAIGAEIENCYLLENKENIVSHSNTLRGMLAYHGLTLTCSNKGFKLTLLDNNP